MARNFHRMPDSMEINRSKKKKHTIRINKKGNKDDSVVLIVLWNSMILVLYFVEYDVVMKNRLICTVDTSTKSITSEIIQIYPMFTCLLYIKKVIWYV